MPSAYFYQNELGFRPDEPTMDFAARGYKFAHSFTRSFATRGKRRSCGNETLFALQSSGADAISGHCQRGEEICHAIQASIDLARVACALERYRLAHGEYPETLDALTPQFIEKLPHDIINGQPLHYRRTDDGKFVLYSVGWNEKDDGGTIVSRKGGTV